MKRAMVVGARRMLRAVAGRTLPLALVSAVALLALVPEAAPASPTTDGRLGVGRLINAERQARGLSPLGGDPRLSAAAYRHAADMGLRGFFSHKGSDGTHHGHRIAAQGYRACLAAENIAWGQRSAQEVVHGWMNSPGHRKIILHPRAAAYGAGFHPERRQWVLVVARPC